MRRGGVNVFVRRKLRTYPKFEVQIMDDLHIHIISLMDGSELPHKSKQTQQKNYRSIFSKLNFILFLIVFRNVI